jgi:hypothetical protein
MNGFADAADPIVRTQVQDQASWPLRTPRRSGISERKPSGQLLECPVIHDPIEVKHPSHLGFLPDESTHAEERHEWIVTRDVFHPRVDGTGMRLLLWAQQFPSGMRSFGASSRCRAKIDHGSTASVFKD